ncbi:unnamed protein product [Kluyveromyces dobzhanskii CBS 2104]|uniref:WGS project CCBQ000000000 data, contig 00006 n=1 Tax=Kluyveromyces dobzhanskii CBS 2104 TaxID=1427455 RepID=A0A0A8L834_9SACH|nr:unnamed protein product [Kluyveromyces dobzhanskii CBS 2104]
MKMRSRYYIVLLVTLFLSAVRAASDEFSLKLSGPKELNGMTIYEDDDSLYIGKPSSDDLLGGKIQDDGTLKLGDDEFVGINKNCLTVTNNFTDYATPFGIDKDGYLTLYSEKKVQSYSKRPDRCLYFNF